MIIAVSLLRFVLVFRRLKERLRTEGAGLIETASSLAERNSRLRSTERGLRRDGSRMRRSAQLLARSTRGALAPAFRLATLRGTEEGLLVLPLHDDL